MPLLKEIDEMFGGVIGDIFGGPEDVKKKKTAGFTFSHKFSKKFPAKKDHENKGEEIVKELFSKQILESVNWLKTEDKKFIEGTEIWFREMPETKKQLKLVQALEEFEKQVHRKEHGYVFRD